MWKISEKVIFKVKSRLKLISLEVISDKTMFSLVFADSYTVAVMILVTWFGANENQNFTLSRR